MRDDDAKESSRGPHLIVGIGRCGVCVSFGYEKKEKLLFISLEKETRD
jgi:hypothetical protein